MKRRIANRYLHARGVDLNTLWHGTDEDGLEELRGSYGGTFGFGRGVYLTPVRGYADIYGAHLYRCTTTFDPDQEAYMFTPDNDDVNPIWRYVDGTYPSDGRSKIQRIGLAQRGPMSCGWMPVGGD